MCHILLVTKVVPLMEPIKSCILETICEIMSWYGIIGYVDHNVGAISHYFKLDKSGLQNYNKIFKKMFIINNYCLVFSYYDLLTN